MDNGRVSIHRERSALIVVDMQPDFIEGGALPTQGGRTVLAPIAELMSCGYFRHCVATQDWHPPGHISFASSHPGREPFDVIELYDQEQVLWPEHCVQGSAGASLHPALPWERAAAIVRKGEDPLVDSYSGFLNNWNADGRRPPTGLAGYLRERGITELFLCGLARDYCVKWSAEDAVAVGFTTYVLWDLTRAVDSGADERVRTCLETQGVRIIRSEQLTCDQLGVS
ncbi:MAG: nicotinamidase [Nitrococcus mobilis]|nr:nicotinamidase [Nitrococcus mobilis]